MDKFFFFAIWRQNYTWPQSLQFHMFHHFRWALVSARHNCLHRRRNCPHFGHAVPEEVKIIVFCEFKSWKNINHASWILTPLPPQLSPLSFQFMVTGNPVLPALDLLTGSKSIPWPCSSFRLTNRTVRVSTNFIVIFMRRYLPLIQRTVHE